ncbi:MAG: topoisomerase C-terminal repeat-containing protein, partial [Methylovirgula sp.]
TKVLDSLNELLGPHIFPPKADGSNPRACPSCSSGQLSLKLGKYGAFIGCSNYPDCSYTRTLTNGEANGEGNGTKVLGTDPAIGEEITLRHGRFGAYVQQGEAEKGDEKPKRSSVPKPLVPEELTLEQAIALLSLPREVAIHPETKQPILAGIGRFGPYVQHGKSYANIGKDENILEIGANRAIDLIIAKESGLSGRQFGKEAASRSLGEHPEGGAVTVKAGRYGPYVNWSKINATLPRDADPTSFTLEEAIALVAAKRAGGAGLARVLGKHPSGGEILLRNGRFGPYVSLGKVNATLKDGISPDTISLDDAIHLLDAKQGTRGKRPLARSAKSAKPKAAAKPPQRAKPARKPAAKLAAKKTAGGSKHA